MTPVAALAVGAWLAASPLPVPRTEVAAGANPFSNKESLPQLQSPSFKSIDPGPQTYGEWFEQKNYEMWKGIVGEKYMNEASFGEGVGWLVIGVSLFDRFYGFAQGVIDLRDVVFFLALIALFVFVALRALGARAWRGVV